MREQRLAARIGVRLGLLVGGTLVAAILIEALLQAGAWYVRATGRELPTSWMSNRLRVLCLGDSNTYGLWLEPEQSYPMQLQKLWTEAEQSPEIEVLNLGVPGTNSSHLLRNLPAMLDELDPDVIVTMIGVNDFWTLPVDPRPSRPVSADHSFLERHSLLYELLYTARQAVRSSEPERVLGPQSPEGRDVKLRVGDQEFEMGWDRRREPENLLNSRVALTRNLQALIQIVVLERRDLVLMTYPAEGGKYRLANQIIRATASARRVPLVDLAEVFRPLCDDVDCRGLLLSDRHPNAEGHRIVAGEVARRIAGLDSVKRRVAIR